jgi:uncharacterized protein
VVDFRLEEAGAGSRVIVYTGLALSGSVTQYGRGTGMIQGIATQLVSKFATRFKAQLDAAPMEAVETAASPADVAEISAPLQPAKPISGLKLFLSACWNMIMRLLSRRQHVS